MKNLGLGDLSVLAYGLNLAGYWPPCFKSWNFCSKLKGSITASENLVCTGPTSTGMVVHGQRRIENENLPAL